MVPHLTAPTTGVGEGACEGHSDVYNAEIQNNL